MADNAKKPSEAPKPKPEPPKQQQKPVGPPNRFVKGSRNNPPKK